MEETCLTISEIILHNIASAATGNGTFEPILEIHQFGKLLLETEDFLLDLSHVADGIAAMIIKCDSLSFEDTLQIKLYRLRSKATELLLDFEFYPDDIVITNAEDKQTSFCLTKLDLIRRSTNDTEVLVEFLPQSFEMRFTIDITRDNKPEIIEPSKIPRSPLSDINNEHWETSSVGHSSEDEESDYYNQFVTDGNLVNMYSKKQNNIVLSPTQASKHTIPAEEEDDEEFELYGADSGLFAKPRVDWVESTPVPAALYKLWDAGYTLKEHPGYTRVDPEARIPISNKFQPKVPLDIEDTKPRRPYQVSYNYTRTPEELNDLIHQLENNLKPFTSSLLDKTSDTTDDPLNTSKKTTTKLKNQHFYAGKPLSLTDNFAIKKRKQPSTSATSSPKSSAASSLNSTQTAEDIDTKFLNLTLTPEKPTSKRVDMRESMLMDSNLRSKLYSLEQEELEKSKLKPPSRGSSKPSSPVASPQPPRKMAKSVTTTPTVPKKNPPVIKVSLPKKSSSTPSTPSSTPSVSEPILEKKEPKEEESSSTNVSFEQDSNSSFKLKTNSTNSSIVQPTPEELALAASRRKTLVQYLLEHNIIEDVVAVDKSSYMIALVFRRQKNVNITLEFWDVPSTPKKIIISHKEFEELPFEPIAHWKIFKPDTPDLLMQSFVIPPGRSLRKYVLLSLFGVYSHSNTRIKAVYVAGEPKLK